jgi:hypothetical protein
MKTLVITLVAFILSTGIVLAKEGKQGGMCMEDRKALCGNVEKGHGAIAKCMAEHVDQIKNAECKAKVLAMKEKVEARRAKRKEARAERKAERKAKKQNGDTSVSSGAAENAGH